MTSSLSGLAFIRTKHISSYDRSSGNADFVRIEAGETKALAEIGG